MTSTVSQMHSDRLAASAGRSSLVFFKRNASARLRLICFPYAGAGATIFSTWHRALPSAVEVCAVQMPGRENRISEPPLTRWAATLDWLLMELGHHLDRPFAVFGHSLGAILAFELARRSRRPKLAHLFVSGRRAPHLPPDVPPTYDLPDSELANELRRLAGTPEEVLSEPEFASVFMPLIRADFRLSQTYLYRPSPPLRIPVTAYGGIDDPDVTSAQVEAWSKHTTGAFRRTMFPGGHFFIAENPAAVFAELAPELETIAAGA